MPKPTSRRGHSEPYLAAVPDTVQHRMHWLTLVALDGGPRHSAPEAWRHWRAELPDFDHVSGPEAALLPLAWSRVEALGLSDPDSARIMGLRRRSFLVACSQLNAALTAQAQLANQGVVAVLGSDLAATLHYPFLTRPGLASVELFVADPIGGASGIKARILGRVEWGSGAAPVGQTELRSRSGVVLKWRHPDLKRVRDSVQGARMTIWQGRRLRVLSPSDVAYSILLDTFLRDRPSRTVARSWAVDFDRLSVAQGFSPDAFRAQIRSTPLSALFAAHAVSAADYLPGHTLNLLLPHNHRQPVVIDLRTRSGPGHTKDAVSPLARLQAHVLPRAIRAAARLGNY